MRIAKVSIKNYKSFRDLEEISFTSGFNVIVGQNNVGKTALVEALSLNFGSFPHRSLYTLPRSSTRLDTASVVDITLRFKRDELSDLLKDSRISFSVPVSPQSDIPLFDQARYIVEELYTGLDIIYSYANGSLVDAKVAKHVNYTHFEAFQINIDTDFRMITTTTGAKPNDAFIYPWAESFRKSIYKFSAERLNVSEHLIGKSRILAPDARNLAEVLHNLQTENPASWTDYVNRVREIFPDVRYVTVPRKLDDANKAHIQIWTLDEATRRTDLTMSLNDCGTGIGQVLAMLYVVLTSNSPRTIIIDEPQSFLHPGAVRKLFGILKTDYSEHQYIITTHSPTAVTAANPQTILLIRKEESESKVTTIDVNRTRQMQLFLSEVGARLSDVFGSDNILWVEGPTEEKCFPLIVSEVLKRPLLGTTILGVIHTGDFEGRHSELIFKIYDRLSQGMGLLPPAIGFVFDREGRKPEIIGELENRSAGTAKFLIRRLYENYLINPSAIAYVISNFDLSRAQAVTSHEITTWLDENRWGDKYFKRIPNYAEYKKAKAKNDEIWWHRNVHGADLLMDLFNELSDARLPYEKVVYGEALTRWLIENEADDLQEVVGLLKSVLNREIS